MDGQRKSIYLTLVIFSLIVSLVATELALRIYNHFYPLYIFYGNSYNRFRGKPFAQIGILSSIRKDLMMSNLQKKRLPFTASWVSETRSLSEVSKIIADEK